MKNIFRHPDNSIAAKLIIAIGMLMIILSFIFWYAILHKQEKDVLSIASQYGDSFINFTKVSTRHSMFTLQKEETQRLLENLSPPEGVQTVQIYNHQGDIAFSSNPDNIGKTGDTKSISCTGCHSDIEKGFI